MRILTNYPDVLKDIIKFYNSVYKTDFVFVEFLPGTGGDPHFAVVEYEKATPSQVFELGCLLGGKEESITKSRSS